MTRSPDNRQPDSPPCPGAAITDEEIMAYADGVLAPERRAIIRQALATDPALMQTLESFLVTRGPLIRPFDEVLATPLPDAMLATLQPPAAKPSPAGRLAAFLRAATGMHMFARYRMPMLAVAALCLVLLGAWLGSYALQYLGPPPHWHEFARMGERGFIALPPLQSALESTPSGAAVRLSERLSIRPVATLRTQQDIWCREFDLLYSSGQRGRSLACRSGDGTWLVPVTTVPQGSSYVVVGGSQPNAPSGKSPSDDSASIIDGARQRMSSDPVVGPEKEKSLIEGRWRQKP